VRPSVCQLRNYPHPRPYVLLLMTLRSNRIVVAPWAIYIAARRRSATSRYQGYRKLRSSVSSMRKSRNRDCAIRACARVICIPRVAVRCSALQCVAARCSRGSAMGAISRAGKENELRRAVYVRAAPEKRVIIIGSPGRLTRPVDRLI